MSLIDDIRKDREAGTPGPWSAFTDDNKPHTNIVSPTPVTQCVFSLNGRHKRETDIRRIARVPDMEAALLAAEGLASCVESLDDPRNEEEANEIYGAMLAALRRYREAAA
ncbi:hypothetical protein ROJ8625_04122 [Roseivivax jejudonensis]|uniref:Uncharacterized protein n=1 Tax=Roseivivax jejudonensis TaxID=1529041 RepID=A0A1X7AB10_9RHOB|nr:hypothetical protein [Roseivivax jejudonensis]SLN74894.1 hypothetical protein ROJ8625_04122 [Roseivivax jejudonensis]